MDTDGRVDSAEEAAEATAKFAKDAKREPEFTIKIQGHEVNHG